MKFKSLSVLLLLMASQAGAQSFEDINLSIDRFLKNNTLNGLVEYEELKSNPTELDALVFQIGTLSLTEEGSDLEKAFLINSYNILVIKQVVDNYPILSPQEIGNFFTEKKFNFGGKKVSLNGLEKEIIFPMYPDARLHFALVCAAKGCPKLRSEAYRANTLELQLEVQTKATLQASFFAVYNSADKSLRISKIFDWYAKDFGSDKEEVIAFINPYLTEELPRDTRIAYMAYDWTLNDVNAWVETTTPEVSNLQLFTPSALFNKGEFEVNVFNSIYSQQKRRNEFGETIDLGQTENFFTSMIMFTTGLSKKSRFNVGLDFFISKARTVSGDHSAFDVFNTSDDAIFNKTLISYIAPRVKFVPLKSVPRLSIQSSLWIPLSAELESEGFVAHDRYTWFTQIFFDQNIGDKFQLFLEADLLYRFASNEAQQYDFFRTPLSGFFSYFPTSKSTIFVFSQYSPRFETINEMGLEEFGLTQWFTQIGIGGKYQITNSLGVEVSYSNFAFSRAEGAGYTVNFGLRYIYR